MDGWIVVKRKRYSRIIKRLLQGEKRKNKWLLDRITIEINKERKRSGWMDGLIEMNYYRIIMELREKWMDYNQKRNK